MTSSHEDDLLQDDDASAPGTLSKFLTGDLTFEEFAKSSLGEELMPPEEVVTGAELVAGEESRTGGEDGDRSSAMDNDSAAKQAEQFATELSRSTTLRKRNLMTSSLGSTRIPVTKKRKLPSHLHTVVGDANLRLARGDMIGAQKLCKEVIRQAPYVAGPYLTLAMTYEETGDTDKYYQLSLIAAHLQKNNYDLWLKLAGMAIDKGHLKDAVLCTSRAIRLDPNNIDLMEQKANLLLDVEEYKKALECFEIMLTILQTKHGPRYLDILKKMARCCHELSFHSRAVKLLQQACSSFQGLPDPEAINLLAELYMLAKDYSNIYQLITTYYCEEPPQPMPTTATPTKQKIDKTQSKHTQNNNTPSKTTPSTSSINQTETAGDFSFNISSAVEMSLQLDSDADLIHNVVMSPTAAKPSAVGESNQSVVVEPIMKEDLPIDLRAKLIIAMINLGLTPSETMLGPLFLEDPEDCGDLYYDIAEAYMENGHPSLAHPFLSALVKTSSFDQAGVWLKHAGCLHQLGNVEDAATSYAAVLSSAPHHTEARLKLAEIYISLGRTDDALAILDEVTEADDNHCEVEEEVIQDDHHIGSSAELPLNKTDEASFSLPHQDIRLVYHKFLLLQSEGQLSESLDVSLELLSCYFRNVESHSNPVVLLDKKRARQNFPNLSEGSERETREKEKILSETEWYTLCSKTCHTLFSLGKTADLKRWLFIAISSWRFGDNNDYQCDLYVKAISVCLNVKDYRNTAFLIKTVVKYFPHSAMLWILQSRLPRNLYNYRMVLKLLVKYPTHPMLLLLTGHHSYTATSYVHALSHYKEFYRLYPTNSLVCLLIGLCFIGMASQTSGVHFSNYRNTLLIQCFAFMFKYARLKGESQEAYYNLARAFHHMGLTHIAVNYYKKALIAPMHHSTNTSLCREAAFNLSLIYRSSGNKTLARQLIHRYCTI